MSVQTVQYLMWALRLPYEWHEEWESEHAKHFPKADFYEHFKDFIDDSAFDSKAVHKDGIFCLFDGMNGKFIFIGRVLAKAKDMEMIGDPPLAMPWVTLIDQHIIRESVLRNFGVGGDFDTWLIAQYR